MPPASAPRSIEHLRALLRRYPGLPHWVNDFRSGKGNLYPDWPGWCFIPMAAWATRLQDEAGPNMALQVAGDIAILGALAPWRYSQGIYRFDPDLFAALAQTEFDAPLPSSVLMRLPEWSLYVETPGAAWRGAPLCGFWAHLEHDINSGRAELRLLLDTDAGLQGIPLHLGLWTVEEALRRAGAEGVRVGAELGLNITAPDTAAASHELGFLVSLLLYLCADEPEIDDARQPGSSPSRPTARKIKRGWAWFPPDAPRLWQVGAQTGEQLRRAQTSHPAGADRRSPRAHVRRAHWHGFWSGPHDGERRFSYRWLPPMLVGGE